MHYRTSRNRNALSHKKHEKKMGISNSKCRGKYRNFRVKCGQNWEFVAFLSECMIYFNSKCTISLILSNIEMLHAKVSQEFSSGLCEETMCQISSKWMSLGRKDSQPFSISHPSVHWFLHHEEIELDETPFFCIPVYHALQTQIYHALNYYFSKGAFKKFTICRNFNILDIHVYVLMSLEI